MFHRLKNYIRRRKISPLAIACLLCIQGVLLGYLSWRTSPNRTEIAHLGASVYYWETGKFDVFHVNPPLTRYLAGAPIALICNPNYDWKDYSPRPQDRHEWSIGTAFIDANEFAHVRVYIFLARLACIPLVLLGGYFGFRFASELYGEWSGALFAVLWTFSPLVLGWGATICPDVAAASMGIVGLYAFWHWLKKPTWWKAIVAGACMGLMPLTKMTWIIAFPIWFVLFAIWKIWRKNEDQRLPWKQFVSIFLLAVYVINAGYCFDGSFKQLKNYRFISGMFTGTKMQKDTPIRPSNRFADSWIGNIPVPLPAEFIQGIDTQKIDFEKGIESYARGVWSDHGWWWYYGYVLLLKEPLAVWALALLALFTTIYFRNKNIDFRNEITLVLPAIMIFAFISSQDGFSLHPRYIVLILPLLYIFVSKIVSTTQSVVIRGIVSGLLIWFVVSSLSFYPYSMSYFNELAGNPHNWPRYLLGSNIDWGQDLYDLKKWTEHNPEARPLYISVEQAISLNKLRIESDGIPPSKPKSGWIIIGVNQLFDKESKYEWLKEKEPIVMIGYSLWVFRIEESASR